MTQLQDQIGVWHVATFGDLGTPEILVSKFREESAEFLNAPSMEEAADCVIVLLAYSDRRGENLEHYIREKLKKIKKRDQLSRDIERGIFPEGVTK